MPLVTRIAATSKSQIASDCNRNSKKSLRLRKHPLKPTLWTREPPVLCGFYCVSEAPHGSGNPPEVYVATTRVWFRIAAIFLAQCDFCDCDTAILLRFLREKLATSKLWLPIASDLWLRLRGSLSWCPLARHRQTPWHQRNVKPLVLFKEDQSFATFGWQYGDARQMATIMQKTHKNRSPPPSASRPIVRDAETTILIKFAFWRGSGRGQKWGKNVQKHCFSLGNSMTINLEKCANFIVRNFVVTPEAPTLGRTRGGCDLEKACFCLLSAFSKVPS